MKSQINITFLGTGTSQGIPVVASNHPVCKSENPKDKRLRVSVLLSWDDFNFVIDCGPDFRQQMLRENVTKLDGILLTHEHSDHTAGMDDIRPFYFKHGYFPFYAQQRVFESLYQRFTYILKLKTNTQELQLSPNLKFQKQKHLPLAVKILSQLKRYMLSCQF